MNTPEQIRDGLLHIFDQQHRTTYSIAKDSGLPLSTIRRLTSHKQVPSLYTLSILCNALDIPLLPLLEPQEQPGAALTLREKTLLFSMRALSQPQQELVHSLVQLLAAH